MAAFRSPLLPSLLLLARAPGAGAQPSAAACCFAGGQVSYVRMPNCEPLPGQRGVSEWLDLCACWSAVEAHFGNRTVDVGPDGQNSTIAERHPIFVVNLAARAAIAAPAKATALVFDSSLLPPGAVPVDGPMRGFDVVFSFPEDEQTRECQQAALSGLTIAITDRQHLQPQRLGIQFAGCGRDTHRLDKLTLTTVGWASPSFEFLSVVGASILTVEPPWNQDHPGTEAALSFIEADFVDSHVRYFGDVSGDFGDSFGATQNGSRALRCSFDVVDPRWPEIYGPTYSFRKFSDGVENYQFSWYGSDWDGTFTHLQDCTIQYISDATLGSISVTGCSITPWIASASPVFNKASVWSSDCEPPGLTVYNMGSDSLPMLDKGCNVTDSEVVAIWTVDITRSAMTNVNVTVANLLSDPDNQVYNSTILTLP
jgi:hypothetical protein